MPRRGAGRADAASGQRRRPGGGPQSRRAGSARALRGSRAQRAGLAVRRRAAGPDHYLPSGDLRHLRDRGRRRRGGHDHRRPRDRAPLRHPGGAAARTRLGLKGDPVPLPPRTLGASLRTRPNYRVALDGVPENMTSAAGKLPIKMPHDRILVALRKEAGERGSSGGILIPATAQVAKRLVWGEARGIGGSVRQVKVGDQVLFSPEDQHEGGGQGEDLSNLRERDVHAVAAELFEESTGLYL